MILISIYIVHNILYLYVLSIPNFYFYFLTDTATTEIYTLSLHDALPICEFRTGGESDDADFVGIEIPLFGVGADEDRKSTRLNSSHQIISYAVFCLKKKKIIRVSI